MERKKSPQYATRADALATPPPRHCIPWHASVWSNPTAARVSEWVGDGEGGLQEVSDGSDKRTAAQLAAADARQDIPTPMLLEPPACREPTVPRQSGEAEGVRSDPSVVCMVWVRAPATGAHPRGLAKGMASLCPAVWRTRSLANRVDRPHTTLFECMGGMGLTLVVASARRFAFGTLTRGGPSRRRPRQAEGSD
jgi:hypothetical protein